MYYIHPDTHICTYTGIQTLINLIHMYCSYNTFVNAHQQIICKPNKSQIKFSQKTCKCSTNGQFPFTVSIVVVVVVVVIIIVVVVTNNVCYSVFFFCMYSLENMYDI